MKLFRSRVLDCLANLAGDHLANPEGTAETSISHSERTRVVANRYSRSMLVPKLRCWQGAGSSGWSLLAGAARSARVQIRIARAGKLRRRPAGRLPAVATMPRGVDIGAWTMKSPSTVSKISDESFVLPSAGLFADESLGLGHVQLPDHFHKLDPEVRLRILVGWRKGMDAGWRQALVALFRTWPDESNERGLPERIEAFRRDCKEHNIDVPSDFGIALQQY
jgi:hypothetical protein